MKPKLLENLFIHKENNRIIYLNEEAPDWITINVSYEPIFNLFDGHNTEDNLFDFVRENYSNEGNIIIPQLKIFFRTSNIFSNNFPKVNNRNSSINRRIKPKYIYLTLTDNCNLKCKYCYATERTKQNDIGLNDWIGYIDQILKFSKHCTFIFTGGEPLLVEYVYDLASYIKSRNCESILLTNGTQIDTLHKAKQLQELFSLIKISLDSNKEEITTELRGEGVVNKVQKAYSLLKDVEANVVILSTVNSLTINDVDEFSKYFENNVSFQPFYEMGRGRENENLSISGKDYYYSLTRADIFKLLPTFHNNIHNYKNKPFKRCAFAIEEISVDSSGNIYPCHMLHYEELNCGNISESDFEHIYYESEILREMRSINVDSISQCKGCTFRNFCGGACRARVDITKNGIDGVNEFCDFEKKAILDALLYSYG